MLERAVSALREAHTHFGASSVLRTQHLPQAVELTASHSRLSQAQPLLGFPALAGSLAPCGQKVPHQTLPLQWTQASPFLLVATGSASGSVALTACIRPSGQLPCSSLLFLHVTSSAKVDKTN
jgi:hypothetical protein